MLAKLGVAVGEGLPAGEGVDVWVAVASCVPDGVDDNDDAFVPDAVTVGDWL